MSETELESAANIGLAIEDICQYLPYGYEVRIELERGAGSVMLFDAGGDGQDFSGGDGSLSEELREALKYARLDAGLNPEVGEAGGLHNQEPG